MIVEKSALGASYQLAKDRAQSIDYDFEMVGNSLKLNAYLLTDIEQRFRDQSVELTLYLPEGSVLYADENTYSFHRNTSIYGDILDNGSEEHYLRILKNDTECLDCDQESRSELKSESPTWSFALNHKIPEFHFTYH